MTAEIVTDWQVAGRTWTKAYGESQAQVVQYERDGRLYSDHYMPGGCMRTVWCAHHGERLAMEWHPMDESDWPQIRGAIEADRADLAGHLYWGWLGYMAVWVVAAWACIVWGFPGPDWLFLIAMAVSAALTIWRGWRRGR